MIGGVMATNFFHNMGSWAVRHPIDSMPIAGYPSLSSRDRQLICDVNGGEGK